MSFEIGSIVGDYQVVAILGAGGMGRVYKVRNVISDRVEAMKVLRPDLLNQPELAERFEREIRVQARLEHPNIASLHAAVRVDKQILMLTEFVEGVTLAHKAGQERLSTADAVDYLMQALAALDYAHSHNVVHRDIKPANMMLTAEGVVKLIDFGIAKGATDQTITALGGVAGTLYYMSPEQIDGATALDPLSDLYSLGVSLYELATGNRPFVGDSQFAIMSAIRAGNPVEPIMIDPRLPKSLNDVILRSVLRNPSGRYQTAGAFRNELANVQAELKGLPPRFVKKKEVASRLVTEGSPFHDIDVRLKTLDPQMRQHFRKLAVLPHPYAASLPILQILWNCDEVEARRIARGLADQSLAHVQREGGISVGGPLP